MQSKLSSKRDLYLFLTQDGKAHLPNVKQVNSYFLSDILQGAKNYITRDQVRVASIPQLEGLTVRDLLEIAKAHPHVLEYLPSERDWRKIDRQWLGDILNTIVPEQLQEKIDIALRLRAQRLIQQRQLSVQLRPEFAHAFQNCLNIAQSKGRALSVLKASTKRRRTLLEREEIKDEEELFKEDKFEYMLQTKRMKLDLDNLTSTRQQPRSFSMVGDINMQRSNMENIPLGTQSLNKAAFNI